MAKKLIADKSPKVKSNFVPSESRLAEYKRTYDRLMERAKGRVKIKGVHDNHHIVPKSLGGSNDTSNIAVLTYDEHFLAHWLLTKFTEGKARLSMLRALNKMRRAAKSNTNRVVSGWQYAVARRANSEATALWHKTPEGQEAMKKGGKKVGPALSAFYATPEGQAVAKERGKKIGETLSAFYETPEGQAVAKETGKKVGAALSAFYETPEGQKVAKERGKKTGATTRARGSKAGENHPSAKVTEELVREIRAFKGSHAEAARHFGVTGDISYSIRKGYTWRHVK